MKKRYGYCICHSIMSSLNAKGLCPIGAKERHERSAESKGMIIKNKNDDNGRNKTLSQLHGIELRDKQPYKKNDVENATIKAYSKIKPISKDKATENTELARLKKAKILELGEKCEMCQNQGKVDLFHIIGVGNKRFATNENNLMLSCREPCHNAWTNNDWSKIVKFKNFNEIMERLKTLDEGKYWKLRHKIEKYYESTGNI